MNETSVDDALAPGAVLAYVVSSTGDGDAPDNCDAFFTKLKRAAKKAPGEAGAGTQYCVLGLGDQNYSAFMAVPRSFTLAMEKAGATAFYPRGEADDTLGLQYSKWQEGLWAPWRRLREPGVRREPGRGDQAAKRRHQKASAETTSTAAETPSTAALVGVPALPACRAAVEWLSADSGVRACTPSGRATPRTRSPRTSLPRRRLPREPTNPESDRRVIHGV